jgi:hypothetical protein
MANAHETEEMEKEIFEVVRESEESVLEAGRKWAKAVADAMPIEMPVMRAVVKGAFDLTEEVLKAQREFALSILRATTTPQAARSVRRAARTPPMHRATPTKKAA